jgi:hypothetical protein
LKIENDSSMSESEKSDGPENPESQAEPKLVVDTDWKEQVAREKEQAQQAAEANDVESPAGDEPPAVAQSPAAVESDAAEAAVKADAAETPAEAAATAGELPPPPATFEVLVSMMFTQAMSMLGQMPDPSTGQPTVNKLYAKHYIDTLDMLSEKTKGNLSDDESKVLSEALHALRMMYVNAGK